MCQRLRVAGMSGGVMLLGFHACLLHWWSPTCIWDRRASQVPAYCLEHQGGPTSCGCWSSWPLCTDTQDWGRRGFVCGRGCRLSGRVICGCPATGGHASDYGQIHGKLGLWLQKYTRVVGHLWLEQARVLPLRCVPPVVTPASSLGANSPFSTPPQAESTWSSVG